MCGGNIEIELCSHVGRIWDDAEVLFNNHSSMEILNISARTAEVWLDSYKTFFYERVGDTEVNLGDLQNQKRIKKRLGCRPFEWFHKKVFPELFIPSTSLAAGYVRNPWSSFCIDSGVSSKHYLQPLKVHKLILNC